MKKIFFSLGLGLSLATGAFAADNTLDQLNSEVVHILAPFQNQATVAQLSFGAVETNADRALKVAVNALYRKVGSKNKLEVKLDNLSYDYGDGTAPRTTLRGSVGIDLTKILAQEELDQIIPHASEMVESLAKEYSREYGDAVSIKSVVTSTTKNSDGNYTGLTALISAKFDLKKLPDGIESEDIMATDVVLSLGLDLHKGAVIDAFVVSNPEYRGFKEDQQGLKEALDKLLARDPESLGFIEMLIAKLDDMAEHVVEQD